MINKYVLTNETREICGKTCYRIKALKSLPNVAVDEGDLGGFVESEENLSQYNECWIFDSSAAIEESAVRGNSIISTSSIVRGKSIIMGESEITMTSLVNDSTIIVDSEISHSFIRGDTKISHSTIRECDITDGHIESTTIRGK